MSGNRELAGHRENGDGKNAEKDQLELGGDVSVRVCLGDARPLAGPCPADSDNSMVDLVDGDSKVDAISVVMFSRIIALPFPRQQMVRCAGSISEIPLKL